MTDWNSQLESAGIQVSPMTEHDLLEVVEIEGESNISPWGWEAYHSEIERGQNALMYVARVSGRDCQPSVVGFLAARLILDELSVNNVAVRKTCRGRGVGSMLISRLIEEAKSRSTAVCMLEVRRSNVVAQSLYRKHGFRIAGVRKMYYSQPPEDAVLMNLELASDDRNAPIPSQE